jgi:ABC-2 type transport system permease protein
VSTRVSPIRGYGLICKWQLLQLRQFLPFVIVAQLVFATGSAIGFGLLIPHIDPVSARYLATGAFLLNLLIVGIVIVPGSASDAKAMGTFDYMWSLPLPRLTYLLADLSIWFVAMLPGLVVSLIITSARFHFGLRPSLLIVPAVVFALLTSASLGYGIALRSPSTQATNLLGNLILVFILLFSPVNYPLSRLPGWLQGIHHVLPIAPLGDIVRAALLGTGDGHLGGDLAVVGLWCAFGITVTVRAVTRRP